MKLEVSELCDLSLILTDTLFIADSLEYQYHALDRVQSQLARLEREGWVSGA